MTNATPEQLDLARKITMGLWPGDDTEYLFERRTAQEAALAAIIETTERACNAVEDYCSDMPDLAGHGHSVGLKDAIRSI